MFYAIILYLVCHWIGTIAIFDSPKAFDYGHNLSNNESRIKFINERHDFLVDAVYGPKSQKEMVDILRNVNGSIKSDRVEQILSMVDRKFFLMYNPYEDYSLFMEAGAIESSPSLLAFILEHLKDHIKEGSRILDIAYGTGYLTVCMSLMAGKTGLVVGIEYVEEIMEEAQTCINRNYMLKPQLGTIKLLFGNVTILAPQEGPFDIINITPTTPYVPQELLDQLKPGGRMIVPLGSAGYLREMTIYDKDMEGNLNITKKELRLWVHRVLW